MTNCLTVSRLATDIYLKNYVDPKNKNIPYIKNMRVYNDIKNAYFGGITEVYIPKGENLKYYDVNSLYPYPSFNAMPGLSCEYVDYFQNSKILDSNMDEDFFGFFYCKIKSYEKGYLGLLIYRLEQGKRVLCPVGSWEGWYFSEELKFARDNGYKIEVMKGYKLTKSHNTFRKYVDTLYDMKANSKDVTLKNLAKLLLNSLIGRYGMEPIQDITKIVHKSKIQNILLTREILQEVDITRDNTLLVYRPGPNKDIVDEFELDVQKDLTEDHHDKPTYVKNVSIPVAAAVTAYARIHMSQIKLNILKNNGKIFYSDTDSIITDKELDKSLVDPSEIGKFKLEYDVNKAIMPAPKVYYLEVKDPENILKDKDKYILRAKGGITKDTQNRLTIKDYEGLLNGDLMKITKKSAKTDWTKGTVNIKTQTINLSPESYISRIKIIDNNNIWVDTLPVNLEEFDPKGKSIRKGTIVKGDKEDSDDIHLDRDDIKLDDLKLDDKKLDEKKKKNKSKLITIFYKIKWLKDANIITWLLLSLIIPISYLSYIIINLQDDEEINNELNFDGYKNIEDYITDIHDLILDPVELPENEISIWEKFFGKYNSNIDYHNITDNSLLDKVIANNNQTKQAILNDIVIELIDKSIKGLLNKDDLLLDNAVTDYLRNHSFSPTWKESILDKLKEDPSFIEHLEKQNDNSIRRDSVVNIHSDHSNVINDKKSLGNNELSHRLRNIQLTTINMRLGILEALKTSYTNDLDSAEKYQYPENIERVPEALQGLKYINDTKKEIEVVKIKVLEELKSFKDR